MKISESCILSIQFYAESKFCVINTIPPLKQDKKPYWISYQLSKGKPYPKRSQNKVSPVRARSNDRVKKKLRNIPENGLKEFLNLILQHYKEEIPILTEAKETAVKQLKSLCDEVRFIRLTDALVSLSEKEQKYLDEGKKNSNKR